MKKIQLEVYNLNDSKSQQGVFALVLKEVKGKRSLPIIIGSVEAQSVAIGMHRIKPVRPLTHDLFKVFSDIFGIILKEINIYNLVDGIFYARLICNNGKKDIEIDARASDAVSIALRFDAPIYTYEFILSQAGIQSDQEESIFSHNVDALEKDEDEINTKNVWKNVPKEELERKIEEALSNEDYELAVLLRDEIRKRKQ